MLGLQGDFAETHHLGLQLLFARISVQGNRENQSEPNRQLVYGVKGDSRANWSKHVQTNQIRIGIFVVIDRHNKSRAFGMYSNE